jgi:Adenylate and Guanylate cyclase catalytic domain
MITKFDNYIFENVNLKQEKVALLFTDIVGSSKLWNVSEKKMFNALDEHYIRIKKIVNKNKGEIVKSIGDAFMLSFKDIKDAINTSIEIQEDLKENPIKILKETLKIRIGFSFGEVYIKNLEIQGKKMKDYYGNVVNTASRMESVVSEEENFAFSIIGKIDDKKEIEEILEDKCNIEVIEYKEKCSTKIIRSERLLTDEQRYKCKPLSQLKGVKEVITYKCKIK